MFERGAITAFMNDGGTWPVIRDVFIILLMTGKSSSINILVKFVDKQSNSQDFERDSIVISLNIFINV